MEQGGFINRLVVAASLLALSSCTNTEGSFSVPENVTISSESIFNPFNVESLFETPNRQKSAWKSSVLKKCSIKEISFQNRVQGKAKTEKFNFKFIKSGKPLEFSYYNYSESDSTYSKSHFYYSKHQNLDSILVLKFWGKPSTNKLLVSKKDNQTDYTFHKGNSQTDQNIYKQVDNHEIVIKKIGKTIVFVEFIVPEYTPMSKIKTIAKANIKDSLTLQFAELIITYTKQGHPLASYEVNSHWAQTNLMKKWEYNASNKLINFKVWINRTLVKDMVFNYSNNHLPSSVFYNGLEYVFNYK
jgi:hypothetical protein